MMRCNGNTEFSVSFFVHFFLIRVHARNAKKTESVRNDCQPTLPPPSMMPIPTPTTPILILLPTLPF